MLPWLAMVGLLLLPRNRTARAWWIFVPLGWCFVVQLGMQAALSFIPSRELDLFCQLVRALAFGSAAIWLTSPYLVSSHRFVAFLKMLLVQAGGGLLAYVTGQDWSGGNGEAVVGLVLLGISLMVMVAALSLAAFACRRRYGGVRLFIWLFAWLGVSITAVIVPFVLFMTVLEGASGEVWGVVAASILVSSGIAIVLLAPFLLLSVFNRFFRDRLQQLLRLGVAEAPPLMAPAPAA
jgi:hypothetical protein